MHEGMQPEQANFTQGRRKKKLRNYLSQLTTQEQVGRFTVKILKYFPK
jgi:hypothetical protein